MSTYTLRDDQCETTIEADTLDEARDAAAEWVRDGDWNEPEQTFWVRVRIFDAAGEELGSVSVRIDPDEPSCVDADGHTWSSRHDLVGGLKENPGVWGNGGGVIINEACLRCGAQKKTNTWDYDRSTGEQGLTSVRYERDVYQLEREEREA